MRPPPEAASRKWAFMQSLEIVGVDVDVWRVPPHRSISDAVQVMEFVEVVSVELRTDTGVTGTGFTYTLGRGGPAIAALIRDEIAPRLVGTDPLRREAVNQQLWWDLHWVGRTGISQLAISAIDIALWDIAGRHYGEPVWRLMGGARAQVPMYHTDCGWLHHSKDELIRESAAAVEQGFRGVKIKVGRPELAEDLDRLRAVRQSVGDDVAIMIDANHAFTPAEAVRRGRYFEEVGLTWFEEPIRADNISGHLQLKEALTVPIALGESLYSVYDIKNYVEAGAVDVIQADVARIGGFTALAKIGAIAQAWDLKVAPHYLMELHVHAVAGLPQGYYVEYIQAFERLVQQPLQVTDGMATAPETPGTGVTFDREAIARLQVPAA
jgi:L-alanine-DL-glutamate epimerase-like enolase superfamily enzyme